MGFPQAGNTLAVTVIGVQGDLHEAAVNGAALECRFALLETYVIIAGMAAANGTGTAAMLGRVEKADQPSRSRSLGPAARCCNGE